ncbi:MAG: hypothetical protein M1165_01540 [Candidatus Pacearchaeota archaeon]|nr:hypothetical protein [Candidatus Pacearchaeota archaeon]MDE1848978.1 hypothetical protein [Nanoarchaeota archaeon]
MAKELSNEIDPNLSITEERVWTYHELGAGHFNYLAGKLGCKEGEKFRYKIIVWREQDNAESNSP